MDSYSFYKSLYDRELARRINLDNAISLPITVLTIIVASNSYALKDQSIVYNVSDFKPQYLILVSLFITLLMAIFYIMRSFNNLFKGFAYKNFAYVSDIVKYEKRIEEYNNIVTDEGKIDFGQTVISKLAELTDDHIIFNDKRSKDLQKARTYLIISLILTSLNFIPLIIKYIRL